MNPEKEWESKKYEARSDLMMKIDHLKDKTSKDAAKAYDAAMTMLQQGHCVRIEILDWGVGFDPEAVPKCHSAWKASDNGQGCCVASAASEARRQRHLHQGRVACCARGTKRNDRSGDKVVLLWEADT